MPFSPPVRRESAGRGPAFHLLKIRGLSGDFAEASNQGYLFMHLIVLLFKFFHSHCPFHCPDPTGVHPTTSPALSLFRSVSFFQTHTGRRVQAEQTEGRKGDGGVPSRPGLSPDGWDTWDAPFPAVARLPAMSHSCRRTSVLLSQLRTLRAKSTPMVAR